MAYNSYSGDKRSNYGNNSFQKEDKSYVPDSVAIKAFYKSSTETALPDLFDKTAQEVAASFAGKNKAGKDMGVSSTQLRRIYDEVKRFEQLLATSGNQWEEQLPYIKMVKSKVAYAVARAAKQKPEEKAVYKNLEIFISSCINLIQKEKDYHVFVSLFEAVYGFYYEKAPKGAN